jgi:hypothetical protein
VTVVSRPQNFSNQDPVSEDYTNKSQGQRQSSSWKSMKNNVTWQLKPVAKVLAKWRTARAAALAAARQSMRRQRACTYTFKADQCECSTPSAVDDFETQ